MADSKGKEIHKKLVEQVKEQTKKRAEFHKEIRPNTEDFSEFYKGRIREDYEEVKKDLLEMARKYLTKTAKYAHPDIDDLHLWDQVVYLFGGEDSKAFKELRGLMEDGLEEKALQALRDRLVDKRIGRWTEKSLFDILDPQDFESQKAVAEYQAEKLKELTGKPVNVGKLIGNYQGLQTNANFIAEIEKKYKPYKPKTNKK